MAQKLNAKTVFAGMALNAISNKGSEAMKDFEALMKNEGVDVSVNDLMGMQVKEFISTNADEAMHSENVGFGQEFVEDNVLSTELIAALSDESSLLEDVAIKQMFAKTQNFPVQGGRVRMVLKAQEKDVAGTDGVGEVRKAATAQITLTAQTMAITIYVTDELLEDSVIGMAQYVLGELRRAFVGSIHEVVINGDTTTGANVNINIVDGNTTALVDGDSTDVIAQDGLRKSAITSTSTVVGGVLDLADIRSARAAMGIKGANPSDLVMCMDYGTYYSLLNLDEVETQEKFGGAFTAQNGVLAALDGIKIKVREEVRKSQADGTISATPANNTDGTIIIAHKPSLMAGYRRQFTVEEQREAREIRSSYTGSTRFAFNVDNTQNNVEATSAVAMITGITL